MTRRSTATPDDWSAAWSERYPAASAARPRRRLPRLRRPTSRPGRYALMTALVLAVAGSPIAVAASGGLGRFTADNARYTLYSKNTRQGDGGAGALVCHANTGNEPCLSMVNKGNGLAGAFRTRGLTGFRLQTSGSGIATPFVLDKNATGQVKYLNADLLDGKDSTQVGREPFVLVNGAGTPNPTLSRNNGATGVTRVAPGDYRVAFGQDVDACTYQGTIADPDANRTISAVSDPANKKQVRITVRHAGGSDEGALVDSAFQLAVFC